MRKEKPRPNEELSLRGRSLFQLMVRQSAHLNHSLTLCCLLVSLVNNSFDLEEEKDDNPIPGLSSDSQLEVFAIQPAQNHQKVEEDKTNNHCDHDYEQV